jgi:hypothetical protein
LSLGRPGPDTGVLTSKGGHGIKHGLAAGCAHGKAPRFVPVPQVHRLAGSLLLGGEHARSRMTPGSRSALRMSDEGLLISGRNRSALSVSFVCFASLPFFFAPPPLLLPGAPLLPIFRPSPRQCCANEYFKFRLVPRSKFGYQGPTSPTAAVQNDRAVLMPGSVRHSLATGS